MLHVDVRLELADLIAAYAGCVDRRDYASLVALFAREARIAVCQEDESAEIQWRTDIEAWVDGVRQAHAGYARTLHFIGQQRLSMDSAQPGGETYCFAHHLYHLDGVWMNRVMGIRYLDRFVRPEDDWRFLERLVVVDWIEFRPTGSDRTAAGWVTAQSGRSESS